MTYNNIKEIENFMLENLFLCAMDKIHEERKSTFFLEEYNFGYFIAVRGEEVKIKKFDREDNLLDTKVFSFSDMTTLANEVIKLKIEELEEAHSEQY